MTWKAFADDRAADQDRRVDGPLSPCGLVGHEFVVDVEGDTAVAFNEFLDHLQQGNIAGAVVLRVGETHEGRGGDDDRAERPLARRDGSGGEVDALSFGQPFTKRALDRCSKEIVLALPVVLPIDSAVSNDDARGHEYSSAHGRIDPACDSTVEAGARGGLDSDPRADATGSIRIRLRDAVAAFRAEMKDASS